MRNIASLIALALSACSSSGVDVDVRRAPPVDDAAEADAPAPDDPDTDEPVIDEPVVDEPDVDDPDVEAPVDDAPDGGPVDAPDDGPVVDDSIGEAPDDAPDDDPDDAPDGLDPPAPPDPPDTSGACDDTTLPLDNIGIVEPAGVDGCPAGMAPIDAASCMDRWEAFVEVVTADGPAPFSPYAPIGTAPVIARSAPAAVPHSNISGTQAAAACANAGKRLCRAEEWSFACRSAAGFTYPWGNDRRDGVCNDARAVHPAVEYFGTSASWIWSELDHPCINQLPNSLARTGTHDGCVNGSGHFDLVGNLHEWIDDAAGTFRGGFYVDTVRNGAGCLYTTTAHGVSHHDYSTGFRCCSDR